MKGIIFESKQGRNAIMANMVIDCTGDGDIFSSAGAEFDLDNSSSLKKVDVTGESGGHGSSEGGAIYQNVSRTSSLAVVYRLGGADFEKLCDYIDANPDVWKKHEEKMNEIAGYAMKIFPTSKNDVVWVDNWILGYSSLVVKDLTSVEFCVRRTLLDVIDYINDNQIPGLTNVWLYDTASQLGTRGSRRVVGEYCLTIDDMYAQKKFDDVIAVFPATVNPKMPQHPTEMPLGVLIAKGIDNLFVAGRCFSSDVKANSYTNLVPHCFALGQAAGVAAAIAAKDGVNSREVDIKKVQEELKCQGVYLPR